ncbi:MAG TPA: hypothetical protein VGS14_11300 [Actinomycetes bacterium]|jgi:hypothetical protein|nr:hypothetical protein [Actinomycetes bacterium]
MKRRMLAVLALAVLLVAVPTAAQAKGASAATISGGGSGGLPGGPITLKGEGEPGSGTGLANLADQAGVFALLFDPGPGGVLEAAPTGRRGPRYTITWIFPNGQGTDDTVRQSVWPYAAGGPLTYMEAGQPVLESRTRGGWYRAGDSLRQHLISLGLPSRQPLAAAAAPAPAAPAALAPAAPSPGPAVWPRVAAGLGLLLLLTVGGALLLRRRSSPGTATAR